jgi:predicted DCC family thiol-disulfide oxidoreductase YuxK
MIQEFAIEMLYDGECPLCMRETRMLQRMAPKRRIRFTNIAAADFDASSYGKTQEVLMAEMHGRLPDGTWVTGVEVFRRLYAAVGLGPVVWLTRLPLIKQVLNVGYTVFAQNRLKLTGRCTEECSVRPSKFPG